MKDERGEIVFVVRMWQQQTEASGKGEWRGSVHQVDSGSRFYVTGPREVADFIGTRLAEAFQSTH